MVLHHFTGRQDAVLAVSRAVRMHCSTTRTPAHPHTRTLPRSNPHTQCLLLRLTLSEPLPQT